MKHITKFDEATKYGMFGMIKKMSGQVIDEITNNEAVAIVRAVLDLMPSGAEVVIVESRCESLAGCHVRPVEIQGLSTTTSSEWTGLYSPDVNNLLIRTGGCNIDVYKTTDDWWWVCVGVPGLSGVPQPCDLCDGLAEALSAVRSLTKQYPAPQGDS